MKLTRALWACCAVFAASVSVLPAQTLTSIDFTPIDGTSWGDSTVRVDFGPGMGTGTLTFTPINLGYLQIDSVPYPYNELDWSLYNGPTTLSDGSIFAPTEEINFRILPSDEEGLSGFRMTVTLDEGNFTDGSVFSVRSLGRNEAESQYLNLVSGLELPDPTQLPTDGTGSPELVLISDGLYGPATNGAASYGLAFDISGGTFTVDLLASRNFQPGGVAMTIATAPVPEPSAVLSGVVGVGFLCLRRRRR